MQYTTPFSGLFFADRIREFMMLMLGEMPTLVGSRPRPAPGSLSRGRGDRARRFMRMCRCLWYWRGSQSSK